MRPNRSIPSSTVIPVLSYPDVREAVTWLTASFGFAERVRIGEAHRAQMTVGDAAVIIADTGGGRRAPDPAVKTCTVTVREADVQVQCDRAAKHGGTILMEPTEFPFGERQCAASIPGGTTGRSRKRSPMSHLRTGAAKPSTAGNPTSGTRRRYSAPPTLAIRRHLKRSERRLPCPSRPRFAQS